MVLFEKRCLCIHIATCVLYSVVFDEPREFRENGVESADETLLSHKQSLLGCHKEKRRPRRRAVFPKAFVGVSTRLHHSGWMPCFAMLACTENVGVPFLSPERPLLGGVEVLCEKSAFKSLETSSTGLASSRDTAKHGYSSCGMSDGKTCVSTVFRVRWYPEQFDVAWRSALRIECMKTCNSHSGVNPWTPSVPSTSLVRLQFLVLGEIYWRWRTRAS